MLKTLKIALLALFLSGLLLAAPLSLAQEDPPSEAETTLVEAEVQPENPIGLATLMFLLGSIAVVIVGVAMWGRDNFRVDEGST